jgi:phage terminase large subunit-like protein
MVWLMHEEERTIDMPSEWGGVIPSQVFVDEAERIVAEADRAGLMLRAMGGVAIRIHTPGQVGLASRLGRLGEGQQEFTDLDFVSYRQHRARVKPLMESLGYAKRRATLSSAASERQIYFHPKGWFFVDVFFDKLLVANHPLDFRRRLELDSPTISPTDLLLGKLQIVGIAGKDQKDTLVLLADHDVVMDDAADSINAAYIARLLSRDWGFWYTVRTNLAGLRESLPQIDALFEEERRLIAERVGALLAQIDASPKSLGWKARSKIGTRVRWYEPVETMDSVAGFGIWRLREEPTGESE